MVRPIEPRSGERSYEGESRNQLHSAAQNFLYGGWLSGYDKGLRHLAVATAPTPTSCGFGCEIPPPKTEMLRRFAFLALGLLAPLAAADEPLPADQFWAEKGEPLLKKFCADCHSGAEAEGEFDLERYTSAEAMRGDRISWNKARKQVAFGAMPPDDVERPNNKERKLLVEAIDRALGEAGGCDLEYKPAAVTARRLNREEYNRTVRDLLSVDLRPAEAFPSDEVGDGFDNNADVLTLPPLLLEKYLDAAEQLADAAIITPEEQKELEIHQDIGGDGLTPTGPVKLDSFVRYQMSPGGSVSAEFTLPAHGKYRVTLSVYTEDTSPFDLPLELVYEAGDGKPPEVLESFAWSDPVQNRFRKDFEFPAGKLKLTARLPEGAKATGEAKGENNRRPPEPVAVISQIRVDGPQEWKDSMLPAPHQQLVTVKPQGRIGVREAAEQVLLQFARRAFRNSVTCDDVKPYVDMVVLAKERGLPYERGLEIATSAILVSPKFLYRIEAVPADAKPGSVVPLDDYQLASRLSYFLWSSAPDAALLDLADRGELQKDDVLRAQVERMLRDPRADSLFDNFAAQWLGLRNLAGTTPNVERYPAFNEDLRVTCCGRPNSCSSIFCAATAAPWNCLTAAAPF